MSETLERVRALVAHGEVLVSLHGYDELAQDNIRISDALAGLPGVVVVEDYPTYAKGPCVLVLEYDGGEQPIHIVWGIPTRRDAPAVLVTGYRPDPDRWDETWRRRRR